MQADVLGFVPGFGPATHRSVWRVVVGVTLIALSLSMMLWSWSSARDLEGEYEDGCQLNRVELLR